MEWESRRDLERCRKTAFLWLFLVVSLAVLVVFNSTALADIICEDRKLIDKDSIGGLIYTASRIAAESGIVHMVWEKHFITGEDDIYYSYYDGSVWRSGELSSDFISGLHHQYHSSLAIEDGKIHVVWGDGGFRWVSGSAEQNVYYRLYNGKEWEPPTMIDEGIKGELPTTSVYPSIDVENDIVYIAWGESDKAYLRKYDGKWGNIEEVGEGTYTSIVVENENIHMAWDRWAPIEQIEDSIIYYRKKNGTVWGATKEIGRGIHPKMAVKGGTIHIVWWSGDIEGDIHYRYHDGQGWSKKISLNGNSTGGYPHIVVDDNEVYAFWYDFKGSYLRTFDGKEWGSEKRILNGSLYGATVENATIHISWHEGPNDPGQELYYTKCFYEGAKKPKDNVTETPEKIIPICEAQGGIICRVDETCPDNKWVQATEDWCCSVVCAPLKGVPSKRTETGNTSKQATATSPEIKEEKPTTSEETRFIRLVKALVSYLISFLFNK